MLDFSIVCGGRTDDVVACTLLSKALHKFGKRHDLPFFTFNPFTASKIPFLRIRQKMGIPTMFIGVPLECISVEGWGTLWEKQFTHANIANGKNIQLPFFLDNHLASFNTLKELKGTVVSAGESLAVFAYDYANHLGIDVNDYRMMVETLKNAANLYSYNEKANRINVLTYIYQPAYIFGMLQKYPHWFDSVLESDLVSDFIKIQNKKFADMERNIVVEKINNTNFAFYTGQNLYQEDMDNFCARVLKSGISSSFPSEGSQSMDIVIAFRKDPDLQEKGFVIEVRTKMSEARMLVDILIDIFHKEHTAGVMITKNRGRVVVYRRAKGLRGSFASLTRNNIIPAIINKFYCYLPAGRLSSEISCIGY